MEQIQNKFFPRISNDFNMKLINSQALAIINISGCQQPHYAGNMYWAMLSAGRFKCADSVCGIPEGKQEGIITY